MGQTVSVRRWLLPGTTLVWGLQYAFLSPVLALLLVAVYHATPGQVGWVLVVYNVSGFVASLVLPALADRRHNYLGPMFGCAVATLALAVALAATTSLAVATVALVVLGGPAGVGIAMLFAHLRHSGAGTKEIVNNRAVFSAAWVAGPPLATLVMSAFGNRSILVALTLVSVLAVVATLALARTGRADRFPAATANQSGTGGLSRAGVAVVVVAFVLLQAAGNTAVAVMGLYVTNSLSLAVIWSGIALGIAAALEIPALLWFGRLSSRFSDLTLVAAGSVAGLCYYALLAVVSGPVLLLAVQVLNAVFVAGVAGVGMSLFQTVLPRPGLAAGIYANTRRVGAILTGPLIAVGAASRFSYRGTFAACAVMTAIGLLALLLAARGRRTEPVSDDVVRPG